MKTAPSLKVPETKPENPAEAPTVEEATAGLVNESRAEKDADEHGMAVQIGRLEGQVKSLTSEVNSLRRQLGNEQERANDLELKVQKGGFSDSSRKFRIYLEIINAFVSRGTLDMATLADAAKAGKKQPEVQILIHAAGLAEVANKAARDREF